MIDKMVRDAQQRNADAPMNNANVVTLPGGAGLQANYPAGYHTPALIGTPLVGKDLEAYQLYGTSLA